MVKVRSADGRPPHHHHTVVPITTQQQHDGVFVVVPASDDDPDYNKVVAAAEEEEKKKYLQVAPLSVQAPAAAFQNHVPAVAQLPAAGAGGGGIYDFSDHLQKAITATGSSCGSGDALEVAGPPPLLIGPPPPQPPSKKPDAAIDHSTFGHRTSIFRGVTRHRWTGRYEAHLWDNSCRREGQTRKGRQGTQLVCHPN
ncbi:hypothetical protein Dimus_025715 [Dionaea muscipula]